MFNKIKYKELTATQKGNYNFQKISAVLADFGYSTVKLNLDLGSADFLAYHIDGESILNCQLKGRLSLNRKYLGKDIHIAFYKNNECYVYPHDEFYHEVRSLGLLKESKVWEESGRWSWLQIPLKLEDFIRACNLSKTTDRFQSKQ
jgi:hypothetical protein